VIQTKARTRKRTNQTGPVILAAVVGLVAILVFASFIGCVVLVHGILTDPSVRTKDEVISPDGQWVLLVDSVNEGALGGRTSVTLESRSGAGVSLGLHDGAWLNDGEVRWADARTVEILGLRMPFVDSAIDTGSTRTTGVGVDVEGYVHNSLRPNEHIVMLSGLDLQLPPGQDAELLTLGPDYRDSTAALPLQRLTVASSASHSLWILTLEGTDPMLDALRGQQMIERSKDGQVEVHWNKASREVTILTSLSSDKDETVRRIAGAVTIHDDSIVDVPSAARAAESTWGDMSFGGAVLPWSDENREGLSE
jgi:hypothetical protein